MKKNIAAFIWGIGSFVIGFFLGGKMLAGMVNDYKNKMKRNTCNMMVLSNWLEFIYGGERIEQYFYAHGYNKIMIYGGSYIGMRLSQALSGTDIKIAAIMDKTASSGANGGIIGTDSEIPIVDCIVVTPVFYYEEIYKMLRERVDIPIISVADIFRSASKD